MGSGGCRCAMGTCLDAAGPRSTARDPPKLARTDVEHHIPYVGNAHWNPTTGCDRVSVECDHCYALTLARRSCDSSRGKHSTLSLSWTTGREGRCCIGLHGRVAGLWAASSPPAGVPHEGGPVRAGLRRKLEPLQEDRVGVRRGLT